MTEKLNDADWDLDLDNEEIENQSTDARAWISAGAGVLVLMALIPLGCALGLCHWLVLPTLGLNQIISIGIHWILYTAVLYAVLMWPLSNMAVAVLRQKIKSQSLRILVVACYLWPPVLAYGYYRGGVPNLFDLHGLFLVSIPASLVAGFLLEVAESSVIATLFFSVVTFVPLFLMNDVLSPLPVVFPYAPEGPLFYYWQTFMTITAMALSFSLYRKEKPETSVDPFVVGLCALAGYSLFVKLLLPLVVSAWGVTPTQSLSVPWELPLFVVCAIGLSRGRNPLMYGLLIGFAACLLVVNLVGLFSFVRGGESTFWELTRFSYEVTASLFFGWFLGSLCRLSVRSLFRMKYVEV